MKILIALCAIPAISIAAPFDILLQQRNIADSATLPRTAHLPALDQYGIMGVDAITNTPTVFSLAQPFGVFDGQLSVSLRWDQIINAPVLSPVATSGDYADLSNKPVIAAQVNSDWSASSGPEQILNKPSLFSGDYSALTSIPAYFAPSAHNQAFSTITATPTTLAGYGIADGTTLTQLATKFTIPAGSAAQYVRGDGVLATLPIDKRIETFTGNTDANGLITVTYSPAYPSVPSVQPGPPPSSDMSWVLVSSTTTGFSIRLVQRSVLTVLAVQVLAGTVTNVTSSPAQVLVVGQ